MNFAQSPGAFDALTGLANRAAWMRAFEIGAADGAARGVVLLDLDRFALVNHVDNYRKADEALVAVARALQREDVLVGRLGGNQFAGLLFEVAGSTGDVGRALWQSATDVMSSFDTEAIRYLAVTLTRNSERFAKRDGRPSTSVRVLGPTTLSVSAAALTLQRLSGRAKPGTVSALDELCASLARQKLAGGGTFVMLD